MFDWRELLVVDKINTIIENKNIKKYMPNSYATN